MKQLVIISGKGGTGKTSVTAAFAHLTQTGLSTIRTVLADADVDAANLELVLGPQLVEAHDFMGGLTAIIDRDLCQGCGICDQVCRFEAVQANDGYYSVDVLACEGCAACKYQCPEDAIRMEQQHAGKWFKSQTRFGPLFHAALRPAQENSGKLVTLVKQQARLLALDEDYQIVLVDGPPGIGCPVISAVSGADLALIVAEPTSAGIHDMQRALATTKHFRIQTLVCVNKFDLYPAGTEQIEVYCREQGLNMLKSIPFDPLVTEAMAHAEPVTTFCPTAPASQALMELWEQVGAWLTPLQEDIQ
jgi:MinD superfamily P-loop ATPase